MGRSTDVTALWSNLSISSSILTDLDCQNLLHSFLSLPLNEVFTLYQVQQLYFVLPNNIQNIHDDLAQPHLSASRRGRKETAAIVLGLAS